jgi:hypothetical protein
MFESSICGNLSGFENDGKEVRKGYASIVVFCEATFTLAFGAWRRVNTPDHKNNGSIARMLACCILPVPFQFATRQFAPLTKSRDQINVVVGNLTHPGGKAHGNEGTGRIVRKTLKNAASRSGKSG